MLRGRQDVGGLLRRRRGRLGPIDPARDLERADRLGIRWVVPGDAEWPAQLDELDGAETLHDAAARPRAVGARARSGSTSWRARRRRRLAVGDHLRHRRGRRARRRRARAGSAVVSGAAFGIDQAAHRGALAAGGRTVAVLACGVDRAYPAAHRALLDHLARARSRRLRARPRAGPRPGSGSSPATG